MDFPQAWEFIRATDPEDHHRKCSWRVARMLCDCSVIWAEYYKRKLAALEWQPITEENMPKVGDEVYSMPDPGCFYPDEPGMVYNPLRVDDLRTFKGWTWAPRPFTHFRPINPPKPGETPAS